jgi:hypothetical protein
MNDVGPVGDAEGLADVMVRDEDADAAIPKVKDDLLDVGDTTSARVISARRRSPPDSVCAGDCASGVRFNSASSSRRRARRVSPSIGIVSRMARMFCSTVSPRKMDGSCGR